MTNCTFCKFVSGKTAQHANGLPFRVLRETVRTLTFLSAYQPITTVGHLLVIPKAHAQFLEEIELETRHELIDEIVLWSGLMRGVHPASNILLNNGKEAGQHEPHVHFHIIPRELDDHLVVDSEPGSVMANEDYLALNEKYSELIGAAQQ